MKIKAIRIKNNIGFPAEKDREVKGMIIALALFASGMIIGAGILRNGAVDSVSDFNYLFNSYTSSRASQNMLTTFFNSLIVNLMFVFFAFCSGVSCIGLPLSASLPFIRGLGTGMLAGYLYKNYAMSGIGYYLLTIFPGAVIAVSAMLVACNISSFMSADILATVISKKQSDPKELTDYMKKYLFIVLFTIGASAADCILTKAFSYLFLL